MNAVQRRLAKAFVHTLGRLSNGICIACDSGLTSGRTVDYVYRNRPGGRLLIGRLFDRLYLAHPAWEAVRRRMRMLEGAVKREVTEALRRPTARQGGTEGPAAEPVRILDIASGRSRYLLNVLQEMGGQPVEALCWDMDEGVLEQGRREARDRGLTNIRYQWADVMDGRTYLDLARRGESPDIVIASGFYDWFDDDRRICESLALVQAALRPGGCFLFSIQTGHVDLRTANELFSHFDGGPLRMTTRPAGLVHDLARGAGFAIDEAHSDCSDCYAIAVARKRTG